MSPSRLVISLAALTLSAAGVGAGCSKVANLTGQAVSTSRDSSPTVSLAAGPRLGSSGELGWLTTVEDRNRRAVLANSLCGEDQGRPLVCALAPLGRVEATFCPAEDAVRNPQRCQPSQLAEVETRERIGWILSAPEGRPKVLSILRGADVLQEVFRAVDASTGIVEVAVCPLDIDGDGVNEAAVAHRSTAAPDTLLVDLVQFKPQERRLGPTSARSPLADGEGCAAPALTSLTVNRATGVLSMNAVATTTTTSTTATKQKASSKP